jgi:hypothetical protein
MTKKRKNPYLPQERNGGISFLGRDHVEEFLKQSEGHSHAQASCDEPPRSPRKPMT